MRLNIGCGPLLLDGYLNLDIEQVAEDGESFLRCDVRRGLPFPDVSVDFINASHFVEHLTLPQAVGLLVECRRVLRPDGRLRVAVPDLYVLAKAYMDRQMQQFAADQPDVYRQVESPALRFSLIALGNLHPQSTRERYMGHQLLLDAEGLAEVFRMAGCGAAATVPFDEATETPAGRSHSIVMEADRGGEPWRELLGRTGNARFAFQRWCAERSPGRILNIGCAEDPGRIKETFAGRATNLDRVDYWEAMYRERGVKVPIPVDVVHDVLQRPWPFESGAFGLVILGDLLEDLPPGTQEDVIGEAARVGRHLCITVPEDTARRDPHHLTTVTAEVLRGWLSAAHVDVRLCETVPYVIPDRGHYVLAEVPPS